MRTSYRGYTPSVRIKYDRDISTYMTRKTIPAGKFCHRHVVSNGLEQELGIKIEELS